MRSSASFFVGCLNSEDVNLITINLKNSKSAKKLVSCPIKISETEKFQQETFDKNEIDKRPFDRLGFGRRKKSSPKNPRRTIGAT